MEEFALCWNKLKFAENLSTGFQSLFDRGDFVDCTIACDGHLLQCHKIVLAICSPYFKEIFISSPCRHPISKQFYLSVKLLHACELPCYPNSIYNFYQISQKIFFSFRVVYFYIFIETINNALFVCLRKRLRTTALIDLFYHVVLSKIYLDYNFKFLLLECTFFLISKNWKY